MAHTNSTDHYNLPQFITTDKPAWLTDVNNAYVAIDTGIHNAKKAGDDAQADATQALSDAGSAQTTANAADGKASGAIASLSEAFLDSSTYDVGDLVMYNNLLYVCHTAVTVPGAWTGASNWSRTDIDTILGTIESAIAGKATVESGSNSDGYYIKFSDGTMICTKSISRGIAQNEWSAWGSCYESTSLTFGDWPQAFYATPIVSMRSSGTGGWFENTYDVSNTSAGSCRMARPSIPGGGVTFIFDIIAIGRWKA